FVQLKAIDKRLNEDGARILNLANLCTNNQVYSVAEKCYDYLIDKGAGNKYYNYARAGVLKSRFAKLRSVYPPDTLALSTLRSDYTATVNELGVVYETVGMLRQKAQLEAYYLDMLEEANITL